MAYLLRTPVSFPVKSGRDSRAVREDGGSLEVKHLAGLVTWNLTAKQQGLFKLSWVTKLSGSAIVYSAWLRELRLVISSGSPRDQGPVAPSSICPRTPASRVLSDSVFAKEALAEADSAPYLHSGHPDRPWATATCRDKNGKLQSSRWNLELQGHPHSRAESIWAVAWHRGQHCRGAKQQTLAATTS